MKTILKLVGLLVCLAAVPAWALRCGSDLVTLGDYQIQVLQKCGEPVLKAHRVEYRAVRLRNPGIDLETYIPVEIEEWTYNFGPTRFMELLRFENGRLIESRPLGYGN
jgi:hypothetical protein